MAIDIIETPNHGTVDIVEVTTGLKGDRGLRGIGIKDAVLQKDGHFVVIYEDGTTKDTGLTAFAETSQYAAAAKTSADASQKSAEASASSAQESSTSATASAKSAEEAKSSSDKASVSANKSADSATNASESAESASTSETNAFASATNAKKSEDASKLSETNAKASETASAKSAESASTSATKAKTSETNAGNSATQASESATKAATSEANAKTSETNAGTSAAKAKISEDNAKKSETTVINKVNEVTANSTLSKAWAVSEESPDGGEDVKSETGKTQSSRTWALLAKTKAGEASSSAANANNSVTEATNQAKIASTKATESNDSAVASAESAAAAKASETNAKAYETESSKNASSASTSAGKAKTSETNAANSESNALQYKTNAEESKTAAAASASNASKSEVNAKASMNSAATSATSASTSATKAATSESHAATSETNAKQALAESQKIKKEVEAALTKVTGFAKYAGSVDNYSDLPVSGNNVGDVWNIVNANAAHQIKAGDNVIWNGKTWDNLSGFVDLSNYPTNADVAKAVVDTTYSGGTITFIHKDGTKSTATIGDTSHATQADQDGEGNNIVETYYKKADASAIHTSIQNQINAKQDKLTFDESPTADSNNPVKSKGIKTAIATAVSIAKTEVEGKIPKVDESLSSTSENPVQNKVIKAELDGKVDSSTLSDYATKTYVDNSGPTIVNNMPIHAIPVNAEYGNALIIFKDDSAVGINTIADVIGPYVRNEISVSNSNIDLSGYAKKSTTLSGYGITDANISDGTITLGKNSITPLTSHQDLSAYLTKADASTNYLGKYATAYAAAKAELDWDGNNIARTYYRATDAAMAHQSFQNQINAKQDKLSYDDYPTEGSSNLVKSDGIWGSINSLNMILRNLISAKQDKLTFDESPTEGSANLVTSGGIKTELSGYAKKTDIPAVTVSGNTIAFGTVKIGVD